MIKGNVNYRPAVAGTHGEMFKCTLFWVKFGNAFAFFCGFMFIGQMAL